MLNLGDLIKVGRIKNSLTQGQLAYAIHFDNTKISRIENNKMAVTIDMLQPLSYALAFDFVSFSKYIDKFDNYAEYNLYFRLKKLIAAGDNKHISEFLVENNIDLSDCQSKDFYYIKVYAYTLAYLDESPDKSLKLCISTLNFDLNNIDNLSLKPHIYEDKLGIYTVLIYNLVAKKDYNRAFILANKLYDYFKEYLFNNIHLIDQSFFIKKLHILTINNLSDLYFLKKDYNNALKYCDEAINTANIFNISKYLYKFYKLKMEILYLLGDTEECKLYYEDAKNLSRILKDSEYIQTIENVVKEKYPNILE